MLWLWSAGLFLAFCKPVSTPPLSQEMFQKLVRANAVITGEERQHSAIGYDVVREQPRIRSAGYSIKIITSRHGFEARGCSGTQDKGLDATTLLTNAANNLRQLLNDRE